MKIIKIIILFGALIFTGCAHRMNPYDAVYNGFYDKAIKEFDRQAYKQEKYLHKKGKYKKNYALPYLHLASAGLEAGSYAVAENSLEKALPIMQRIKEDKGKNIAAIIGQEDARQYKGDPYERMMADFYLGFVRYYKGEYERALALFRRALVDDMDTNSKYERDLSDFSIVSIMASKCYALLGEMDNAQAMLDKAEAYVIDRNSFTEFKEHFLSDNFTIIIGDGIGPYKMSVGASKSAIKIKSIPSPVETIQFFIDEKAFGEALHISDVYIQAKSHKPSGGRRTIQALKGFINTVTKTATSITLLASKSDSRSWILLPNDIYLFSAKLEPGLHTINMKCFDRSGQELKRYEQRWYYIPVDENKKDNVLMLRTGIDKCNMAEKIARVYALNSVQLQDVKSWK